MTRVWVRELPGWMLAAAVALITVATVASSPRAELLFRDGDSLVVALLSRSILSGEPLDWAMSSVLFLPETALFTGLRAVLPLGVDGLFTASAVVGILALYGAIRLAAGRARAGRAPVGWSVAAVAIFGLLAMTETTASRDALELASLQLTTTYYSATVIAVVLSIGLSRRVLDSSTHTVVLGVSLGAVAALSTLTNPLYAAWFTIPFALVSFVFVFRRALRVRIVGLLSAALTGTGLGFLLRIPFAAWIANTGAGYAQPSLWRESIGHYSDLAAHRLQSPLGVAALLTGFALLGLGVLRSIRADDPASRMVAVASWAFPVAVVLGAIALGTHAARYLEPIAFLPVLSLVASPHALRLPIRPRRTVAVIAAAIVLVVGAVGATRLTVAASEASENPDLACVTAWIDASGRTGAGQFWTARLPKLHLDDPAQLVQVDHRLNGYAWLVNRTDFAISDVSFLVEDSQSVPWELPKSTVPDGIVECGRWSILDFSSNPLPLGPVHS
ncbi:hypothetical protein [Microbacterium hydrocarbonoxydans]|uniref:hypothetical protein n=1 Tax=Microbacterium hydrocarbonoxydans TaxID=273678 RepID=UPI00203D0028|nr:hypothetical protein [Microbacterium hydrocarbonoxydans]MCM3778555.1 hypothetical protein [Microbacterium hydrocarbonoxydans]